MSETIAIFFNLEIEVIPPKMGCEPTQEDSKLKTRSVRSVFPLFLRIFCPWEGVELIVELSFQEAWGPEDF